LQREKIVAKDDSFSAQQKVVNASGYFTALFGKNTEGRSLQTASGMASTFITANGAAENKFYVLMNEAPPGSVVKLTADDGKSVFAKVLWNMNDMQEENGELNFEFAIRLPMRLALQILNFI